MLNRVAAWVLLAIAWAVLGGCVPRSGGRCDGVARGAHSLDSVLRDAVNEARAFHGFQPVDKHVRLYGTKEFPPRQGDLFGHRLHTPYATRTELYVIADQEAHLKWWIAVAKDRRRYFLIGESGTPESLTAFLKYEGRPASPEFGVRDALAFMDFWAVCTSYEQGEKHVVWSLEDIRRLHRLHTVSAGRLDEMERIKAALSEAGVEDIAPQQKEILPDSMYMLEFFCFDPYPAHLVVIAVVYNWSTPGPPEITHVVMETVYGMTTQFEDFREEASERGEDVEAD